MSYNITYKVDVHPEGIEREQVPQDHGACTVIVVGSIIYNENGDSSTVFVGRDGRSDQTTISPNELWKAWAMLAHQLAGDEELPPGKRDLCKMVHGMVSLAIREIRENAEEEN